MQTASRMMQLFSGLVRAHGEYRITGSKGDKHIGEATTVNEPVTEQLWKDHLDGKKGIGVVVIKDDSTCLFGAIDIDCYSGLNYAEVIGKIRKKKYPLVACRSKSGGLHLFLFLKTAVKARELRNILRSMAASLGFGNSEIFPKQSQVLASRGDIGSWINMPYFDYLKTVRFGIYDDGSPMDLSKFLEYAENKQVELKSVDATSSSGDFTDGPPCIQHLVEMGIGEGMRNETLINIAKYLKKSVPMEWRKLVE
jgi:hypothetical protein